MSTADSKLNAGGSSSIEPLKMRWLVVGGAARSGTTILMEILNTNPNIGLFAEFPLDKMLGWIDLYFEHEKAMNQYAGSSAQNLRPWKPWPMRTLHFDALAQAPFRAAFSEKNLRVIGVKMPDLETKLNSSLVETYFKDLRFIHIVRNPIDTIASSLARRNAARRGEDVWHISTVEEAIATWTRSWGLAREMHREKGQRTLLIKYEDMQSNFHRVKAEIAAFLDVVPEFRSLFSADLAARDLSPLNDAEKTIVGQHFGAIDELWTKKTVVELMEMPLG
jgi:Sulfotransferase family